MLGDGPFYFDYHYSLLLKCSNNTDLAFGMVINSVKLAVHRREVHSTDTLITAY